MLNGFQPIMQPDQVQTTADYYNHVFMPLGTVTPMMSAQNLAKFQAYLKGFAGMQTDAAKLVPLLAQAMHMTPAQVQTLMATQLPAMAAMLQNLPAMQRDFGGLLGTMQQNVGIFSQVPGGARPLPAARDDDAGATSTTTSRSTACPTSGSSPSSSSCRARCCPARRLRPLRESARVAGFRFHHAREADRRMSALAASSSDTGSGSAVAHPLPDELVELIAERFRALAEPTRIKLLDRLREGEATVLELTGARRHDAAERLQAPRPPQRRGIVARRKQGNFAYYRDRRRGRLHALRGRLRQPATAAADRSANSSAGAQRLMLEL